MDIAGFRFGDMAYLTDVSEIPESSFALLEGLETLVLPVAAAQAASQPRHREAGGGVG